MQITNKHGLSDAWVKASENQYQKHGDYSATGLIAPPRQSILTERYDDKISEDVTDRIWALLGNSVHYVLQHSGNVNAIVEQRLSIDVLGKTITFQPDRVERIPNVDPAEFYLKDFKVTSAWSVVHAMKEMKGEWEAQTNIYAYGERQNGINVTKIAIEALIRDWNFRDAMKQDYPDCQVQVLPVEMWSDERCKAYLEERVKLHVSAANLPDADLPYCSMSERWAKPDAYAVHKQGSTRAIPRGLKASRAEAIAYAKHKNDKRSKADIKKGVEYAVAYRSGESIRCERYCPVKDMCSQYRTVINPAF